MTKETPHMVEHWGVKLAIFVGGHELMFAEDESNKENKYLVRDCSYDNPFGVPEYSNCIGAADYLEAISEYANRIQTQTELVRQERRERGISDEPLTRNACLSDGLGENFEEKLVVIRSDVMMPDRRTADYQYFVADGGNGCRTNAIGRAVFGQNLYTGKRARWERQDILGIADPEKLPEWAKGRLKALQEEKQTDTHPRKKAEAER